MPNLDETIFITFEAFLNMRVTKIKLTYTR